MKPKSKSNKLLLILITQLINIILITNSHPLKSQENSKALPVAVFHGLGDACIFPGMLRLTNYFSRQLNTYSRCIETGGNILDWFTNFHYQAKKGCERLKSDKNFHKEFSVVGLSQGSLLARYIIETCDMPGTVKNYISIGGPQMGVGKLPHCPSGVICNVINSGIDKVIYFSLVQKIIGPAGYFKNPNDMESYLNFSTFLADLNNERKEKNSSYKERFSNLDRVLLIKFTKDTMIIPRETAHFEFYDEKGEVRNLMDSDFYKDDYIGLRKLIEEKKVQFENIEGDHLHFSYSDVDKYMIPNLE